MPEQVAIFPLEVVLLPGEVLPLHIFEPRYKLLVRRVLEGRERMGINLLLQGRFHRVGCLAPIQAVLRRYADGRMDIAVQGERRYRVVALDEGSQPYWVASIEWVDDIPEAETPELRRECERLYEELLLLIRGSNEETQQLLEEARQVEQFSFYVGKHIGLEPLQRQQLLELPSEQQRLRWVCHYLQTLLPRLRSLEETVRRIRSNGHFSG